MSPTFEAYLQPSWTLSAKKKMFCCISPGHLLNFFFDFQTILDKNCGKKENSHILCSFSAPPPPTSMLKSLRPSVNQH